MYKILPELAGFCRRCDKNIVMCFRCIVSTAVHLQNANAKFDKVVLRRYSGDVENAYGISVWQLHPRQEVPTFIRIDQVIWKI